MSAADQSPYGDVLAAAPSVLAETALRQVQKLLDAGAPLDDVRDVAAVAVFRLDAHQAGRKPWRGRKRLWLAKVASFAFPRTFSTGPLPKTDDVDALMAAGRRHHHVCFTVEITDGGAGAVGRSVEVQVPADDAVRFAQQMLRITGHQLASYCEGGER